MVISNLLQSCGGDNDTTPIPTPKTSVEITATGITITIDENPTDGQVLGKVTGTVNQGEVTFSLTEENPSGAMAIDTKTGELTVADTSKFDFEANPTLTAKGIVSAGGESKSASISISLNNLPEKVTAPDATFSINENPKEGQSIGKLAATTDAGTLKYAFGFGGAVIAPAGVALDASTGELTVNGVSNFDYESLSTFDFSYAVTNGADTTSGNVTININDVDERPVQVRLDDGQTPKQIVSSGVSADSLYGKTYGGGFIFQFDEASGSGKVIAHMSDPGKTWHEAKSLIQSSSLSGHSDWVMPTLDDANSLCNNWTSGQAGLLNDGSYTWTSTDCRGFLVQVAILRGSDGDCLLNCTGTNQTIFHTRGVRSF